jgi:3-dehydroquinate synthetase
VGLLAAARLSHALAISDKSLPTLVDDILRAVGLPRKPGWMKSDTIFEAMGTDKKRRGQHLRFVLLRDVCQPVIVEDVPESEVIKVLDSLR